MIVFVSAEHGHAERTAPAGTSRARTKAERRTRLIRDLRYSRKMEFGFRPTLQQSDGLRVLRKRKIRCREALNKIVSGLRAPPGILVVSFIHILERNAAHVPRYQSNWVQMGCSACRDGRVPCFNLTTMRALPRSNRLWSGCGARPPSTIASASSNNWLIFGTARSVRRTASVRPNWPRCPLCRCRCGGGTAGREGAPK